MTVEYVTEDDLTKIITRVLDEYPWFEDYPVTCHVSCARWEIADEHGYEAGESWEEYDNALWMLTGGRAGK
jgi:hypothetical protein